MQYYIVRTEKFAFLFKHIIQLERINIYFIKIFHISHPVAQGVGIGTSSHAVGTTKAVELGEIQGAMSGISIGVSGIITVLLSLLLP